MVRHIGQQNGDLEVKCFPGIRTEEVRRKIERQQAQEVVIDVGTNNIRRQLDYITGHMYDLATAAKTTFPKARIVIIGIVRRRNVHWWRIGRINEAFDWVTYSVLVKFVDPIPGYPTDPLCEMEFI
ncbi:hypothetical protein C0J52_27917 [Blattella germanica]|nr:hypothetical protein C0J52_27917 [Blattella germanica]